MKKTILAITLLTAVIVGCKKSGTTTINFSDVNGRWDGKIGNTLVPMYLQISSDGNVNHVEHNTTDPNSTTTTYVGKWKFDAANMILRDTVSYNGLYLFDSLKVSADFRTMSGRSVDTTGISIPPYTYTTYSLTGFTHISK